MDHVLARAIKLLNIFKIIYNEPLLPFKTRQPVLEQIQEEGKAHSTHAMNESTSHNLDSDTKPSQLFNFIGGAIYLTILLLCIRKRFKDHQLLQETKAREIERQIQREQLDRQYAQRLSLALRELQGTMDPLIAAQVYNNQSCPLTGLPEELLLSVINFLADDPVTLHCLRPVSRRFLRLLSHESDIWRSEWYTRRFVQTRHCPLFLIAELRRPFRQLLQRDGRCGKCRRWNDAYFANWIFACVDDCKFEQRNRGRRYGSLYCNPCDSLHDECKFSLAYQQAWEQPGERRCLAQQGSVKLCQHLHIAWSYVLAYINDWRQQHRGGGDWQAFLDNFNIECHDPIHDTRCNALVAPTWPRARLRTAASPYSRNWVVLSLEWAPHGHIDAHALTKDGRVPAPQLRALFRRIRQLGPADFLYPPSRPGALPEMACINASSPFIYYQTGEDDESSCPQLPSNRQQLSHYFKPSLDADYGYGHNGRQLVIRPHFPKGGGDADISLQCLQVSYKKDFMVCRSADLTDPAVKISPTYPWLHAMDTETYPHPEARQIRPQCRDKTCVNYYRRTKAYCYCP